MPKTILVADDHALNRKMLVTLLRHNGYHLLEAADGVEALAIVRAEHPDLVITDILMPAMDGYEFVRQLRADPQTTRTPVIFYTANYYYADAEALARDCGVSQILIKPTESKVLLKAVEETLAASVPLLEPIAPRAFSRKHRQLLMEKLAKKVSELEQEVEERKRTEKALLQSERRFRSLITATTEIVWTANTKGEWVEDCPAWTQFTGQSEEDRKAGRRLDMLHPDDQERIEVAWARAVAKKTSIEIEFRLQHRDGEYRSMLSRGIPVFDNEGNLCEWVGICNDITARKRAEEALAEREQLAALLTEVSMAVTHGDTLSDILQCSAQALVDHLDAAFARIWTLNTGENMLELQASAGMYTHIDGPHGRVPVGQFKIGLIAEERQPHLTNAVLGDPRVGNQEWAKQEGMVAFAGHPLIVNNRLVGVMAMFARHTLSQSTLDALAAVAHGIALGIKRKQTEDALRRSEDRLNDILCSLKDVVWSVPPDVPDLLYLNPAAEEVYGRPVSAFYANPNLWLEVVHPEDRECAANMATEVFKKGSAENEHRIVRPDGEMRWLHNRCHLIRDASGTVIRIDGIITDITERKQAQEHIRRQFERLTALRAIDIAISGSFDLRITLNIVLDQVLSLLGVHAASILLHNPHSHALEYAVGRGFRGNAMARSCLRLGEGIAGRAALERCRVYIPDLSQSEETFVRSHLVAGEDFAAYCAVPLVAKGQVQGILEVFFRAPGMLDPEGLEFLEMLAGQAAIAIDNATLFNNLQRSNTELTLSYDTTLEGWIKALDLRDKETEGHTLRVTEMTVRLARAMGMQEEELVQMRRGALLHDIGKLAIPDAILLKPAALTDEEWTIMRRHPTYAYEWLAPIPYLRPALDIPYCHHEKWDGTGYPRGLREEQIPLAARLFAVVDVWDALRSDRPYRKGWPEEKVIEHIRSLSGTHFDPQVVVVFLQIASAQNAEDYIEPLARAA